MKKTIFLVFFFLFSGLLWAQVSPINSAPNYDNDFSSPHIVKPSPTVATLLKMDDISLNKYTGQPQISIPLFHKEIQGLDYSLFLGYDVTGIRDMEQSGWVGTGWSLQVGGVVSRTVVGLPDDFNPGGGCGNPSGPGMGVNYNCYFDVKSYMAQGIEPDKIKEFLFNAQYENYPRLDYQQDLYHFNFFGHAGKFLIDQGGHIKIIGQDHHLKITAVHQSDWRSSIESFEITDANGYVYTFGAVETTTNKRIQIIQHRVGPAGPGNSDYFDNITFRSAWKLTHVKSPFKKNLVSITYQNVTEKPKSPLRKVTNSVTPEQINSIKQYNTGSGLVDCEQALNQLRPESITSYNQKTIASQKVLKINFADGAQLNFDLSLNHPEYRNSTGAKLHRIKISEDTGISQAPSDKTFTFFYDPDASAKKLLFLNKIAINDTRTNINYQFHYKNLENLASFGNEYTDAFGYYKSHSGFNDLNRSYRTEGASGALDTLTYPTGGKRIFNWESNTYSFYKGNQLLPKLKILNNPDNYTINSKHTHLINCENSSENDGVNGNYCSMSFSINNDQSIQFDYALNFDLSNSQGETGLCGGLQEGNGLGYNKWYLKFTDTQTHEEVNFYFHAKQGTGTVTLEAGNYTVVFRTFCQVDPQKNVELSFGLKNIHDNLNWFLYGGGVRIRAVADYDQGSLKRKKVFNYQLEHLSGLGTLHQNIGDPIPIGGDSGEIYYSSGSFDGISLRERKYTITEHPFKYPTGLDVTYQITESLNTTPAELTHGSYVGYKNVAVFRTSHSEVAEALRPVSKHSVVKYLYDSPIDYPRFPSYYNFPFILPTDIDYKRGNLREKSVFNRIKSDPGTFEDRLIKKTGYAYNYDAGNIAHNVVKTYHNVNNINNRRLGRWFVDYGDYKSYINGLQNNPQDILHGNLSCFCSSSFCYYPVPIGNTINVIPPHARQEVRYKVQRTNVSTTAFFYDGQSVVHALHTVKQYTYDPANYQIKEKTVKRGDEKSKIKYYYSVDNSIYNSTGLMEQHRLNTVVAMEKYRNGDKVATRINRYKEFNNSPQQLYLQKVQSAKYHPPESGVINGILGKKEDRIVYHQYDAYGNPLEVGLADGASVTYIWGYHHTLPVAKIVNATAPQVKNVLGIQSLSLTGNLTTAQKQILRNGLPHGLVSTYSYDVVKGLTAQTDPRGRTTTFEYDGLNRLENIRDHEDHLLTHYTYHYYSEPSPTN